MLGQATRALGRYRLVTRLCITQARASVYRCALGINPHHQLSLSLSSPRTVTPCPPSLPHPPPIPTLPPFSTLLWKSTTVRLSKTSSTIPSFPAFNPVVPPKIFSTSFESNPPSSINPRIPTTVSPNGSHRPSMSCTHFPLPLVELLGL
jgi:hypothetical protein